MTPQEKLKKMREELRQTFLERTDLIDGALAALLSSHHVLIVGPPGTAKSMLADEICRRIEGANYFQWLLTRFTTPEEIFGAVSLKALEQDDYRRVTDHKLPQAHIAFLDEIFKANSSILNAILTLINERLFHNGKEVAPVPLLTLFGASNELPEEEELTALYDRFLVRFVVNYIAEDFRFLRMLESQPQATRTSLTLSELRELQEQVRSIAIPSHVYRSIADIRRALNKKSIQASDRRYRQSLSLLQARAYLEGQQEVFEKDLFFLEHVLWRDPGEQEQVQEYHSRVAARLRRGDYRAAVRIQRDQGFRFPLLGDQRRTGAGAWSSFTPNCVTFLPRSIRLSRRPSGWAVPWTASVRSEARSSRFRKKCWSSSNAAETREKTAQQTCFPRAAREQLLDRKRCLRPPDL